MTGGGLTTVIAGSRGFLDGPFSDEERIEVVGDIVSAAPFEVSEVVSGTARGADRAGEVWAHSEGLPVTEMPADWDEHGKSAGPIRNEVMAEYASACIAIWDGKSAGTRSMIQLARDAYPDDQVHVHVYR